jgi:glycine C-acetyltransferase
VKHLDLEAGVSIGKLREQLSRDGIEKFDEIAERLHEALAEMHEANPFAFEVYSENGVDAEATLVSQARNVRRDCILWTHNVYLGLNRHPRVIERASEALRKFGTACGGPPPIAAQSGVHAAVAQRVASMLGKERALLFPTGYTANLGAISALPGRNDLVLFDSESHASMFQGGALAPARWISFRHNDVEDLGAILDRYREAHPNVFVVVESAYSMSGDLCPLERIVALRERYGFLLFVDEAHTFGFYGTKGRGYCESLGVLDRVDFVMSTFSKATASIGGFIAAKRAYCSVIELGARSYLAQACFPPVDAAVILAALDEIENEPSHAARLHDNNRYMRERLRAAGFDLGNSASPVIPVRVAKLALLYELAARLCNDGIFAQPITEPIVRAGEGRLRFVVTARHTREHIDRTVAALAKHGASLGLIEAR